MGKHVDPHIFISYKRDEGDKFAEAVERELALLRVPFWRDVKNLRYGKQWSPDIDEGIDNAIALVLIVTPGIVVSPWITYEWARAMGKGIPVFPVKCLPIDDKNLHDHIRAIMYADYTRDGEAVWAKLLAEFERVISDHPQARIQWLLEQVKNSSRSAEERKKSIELLAKYKEQDVVEELLNLLRDPMQEAIHVPIIFALGKLGDTHAIMDLIEIVERGDLSTSHVATFALGQLGDSSIAPKLKTYLKSNDDWIRSMAAEGIGTLEYSEAAGDLVELVLYDPEWFVRNRAAEALGKLGDEIAVLPLCEALRDLNVAVRQSAAEALGKIRHPDAVPSLIQALNDTEFYYGNSRVCDEA